MSRRSEKAVYWVKLLSKFISVQLIVQALGFASGILIIRTLSKEEYAYFTIANTLQSTMSLLADTGIGMSLSALGGKIWPDRYHFSQLINTAMKLRYSLAIISTTIVTPILIWTLLHNGASSTYTILITVAVLIGLSSQLTFDVLLAVPRLHSKINIIQNLDLFSSITRLVLLGITHLFLLNALLVVAITSILTLIQKIMLRYWCNNYIDESHNVNLEFQKIILNTVLHQAPNSIYYCFQGQLLIILISLFGNTNSIAELGALGRLSIMFSLINSIMSTIVLPYFSRCQSADLLRKRYWQLVFCIVAINLFILGIALLFPSTILWVLGGKYTHLQNELILIILSSSFNFIVGTMWSINATKAWIKYSWVNIPLTLAVQACLIVSLDLSKLYSVIIFSLISLLPSFFVNMFLTYRGINEYQHSEV